MRCAEPSPSAATTTRKPSASSSRQPIGESLAVADDRTPTAGVDHRRVGRLGYGADRPHRLAAGQQPIGLGVQARERAIRDRAPTCRRALAPGRPPRRAGRWRGRASGAARPARPWPVAGSTSVSSWSSSSSHGSQLSMPSNSVPSARRSHCSRPHGSVATSLAACARTVGDGDQLAGGEDERLVEVVGAALVVDCELGQPIDLVAPQVDADRRVGGRREDVDDRAALRELAAMLDQRLAPVAEVHQVARATRRDRASRPCARGSARRSSRPGPSRCSSARTPATMIAGHRSGDAQSPQHLQPMAHRLDARADALERQRLPRGEQLDLAGRHVLHQVVEQLAGVGAGRAGDDERAALAQLRECRDARWRAADSGTATNPLGSPSACVERRFVAEQAGE